MRPGWGAAANEAELALPSLRIKGAFSPKFGVQIQCCRSKLRPTNPTRGRGFLPTHCTCVVWQSECSGSHTCMAFAYLPVKPARVRLPPQQEPLSIPARPHFPAPGPGCSWLSTSSQKPSLIPHTGQASLGPRDSACVILLMKPMAGSHVDNLPSLERATSWETEPVLASFSALGPLGLQGTHREGLSRQLASQRPVARVWPVHGREACKRGHPCTVAVQCLTRLVLASKGG